MEGSREVRQELEQEQGQADGFRSQWLLIDGDSVGDFGVKLTRLIHNDDSIFPQLIEVFKKARSLGVVDRNILPLPLIRDCLELAVVAGSGQSVTSLWYHIRVAD